MELTYRQEGHFLYPDLEQATRPCPIGKYGMLRRAHLRQTCPGYYNQLLATGVLSSHLQEVDQAANGLVEQHIAVLLQTSPPPDKRLDPLGWVGHMNNLKSKANEMVLHALIYCA